ncbi:hypothetical protein ATY41_02750 [Leifsonia xyli subsp. xyli]|nr:HK97 family phage prohead protease [Leifsonia xyli]ODA89977.1 hypothetical protein ATY41_02750 [Leifsonia xyli subsp. xyli]
MGLIEQRSAHYGAKPREMRLRLTNPEIRDNGDGSINLVGYASVTDSPYEVNDMWGSYMETIARGAFAKSLQESEDVRLLVNHDGIPLARTRSGTLNLHEITDPLADPQGRGQTGLWSEAPNLDPASPLVQTVASAMRRGDLSEMSFAFSALRQTWNADYTEREVNECHLFDVSVVTYPANPATSASLRDGDATDQAADTVLTDEERAGEESAGQVYPEATEAQERSLALARARAASRH